MSQVWNLVTQVVVICGRDKWKKEPLRQGASRDYNSTGCRGATHTPLDVPIQKHSISAAHVAIPNLFPIARTTDDIKQGRGTDWVIGFAGIAVHDGLAGIREIRHSPVI